MGFDVSYALLIISLVLIIGLIILLVDVIVLFYVQNITPKYDGVSWVSYHLL